MERIPDRGNAIELAAIGLLDDHNSCVTHILVAAPPRVPLLDPLEWNTSPSARHLTVHYLAHSLFLDTTRRNVA